MILIRDERGFPGLGVVLSMSGCRLFSCESRIVN